MYKLVITIVLLFVGALSFACSCAFKGDVESEFHSSDAVFVGKVLSQAYNVEEEKYVVTLQILKTFKGEWKKEEITIKTRMGAPSCGYNFSNSKNHVVYGNWINGVLETNQCTRSTSSVKKEVELITIYLNNK